MYKLLLDVYSEIITGVLLVSVGASIPFDPANTDYQTFKRDVEAGAELQDADGVVMSHDDAVAFIKTLP